MNRRFEIWAYFVLIFTVRCALPMEKEEAKKPRMEAGSVAINTGREQLLKAIDSNDLLQVEDILKKFSEKDRFALLNDHRFGKYTLEAAFVRYNNSTRVAPGYPGYYGSPEAALAIFKKLLEYGADINLSFEWREGVVRTLLSDVLTEFDGSYRYTDDSVAKVKFLLSHGADPEKKTLYQKKYGLETPLQAINRMIKSQKDALTRLAPGSKARPEREKAQANTFKVKTLLENTVVQREVQREAARKGKLEQGLKAEEGKRILYRVQQNPSEQSLDFLQSLKREGGDIRMKD